MVSIAGHHRASRHSLKNIAYSWPKTTFTLQQQHWKNVLWTDCLGRKRCKKGTTYYHYNIIPMVKYSGRSIMIWGCFAALENRELAILEGEDELPTG